MEKEKIKKVNIINKSKNGFTYFCKKTKSISLYLNDNQLLRKNVKNGYVSNRKKTFNYTTKNGTMIWSNSINTFLFRKKEIVNFLKNKKKLLDLVMFVSSIDLKTGVNLSRILGKDNQKSISEKSISENLEIDYEKVLSSLMKMSSFKHTNKAELI